MGGAGASQRAPTSASVRVLQPTLPSTWATPAPVSEPQFPCKWGVVTGAAPGYSQLSLLVELVASSPSFQLSVALTGFGQRSPGRSNGRVWWRISDPGNVPEALPLRLGAGRALASLRSEVVCALCPRAGTGVFRSVPWSLLTTGLHQRLEPPWPPGVWTLAVSENSLWAPSPQLPCKAVSGSHLLFWDPRKHKSPPGTLQGSGCPLHSR